MTLIKDDGGLASQWVNRSVARNEVLCCLLVTTGMQLVQYTPWHCGERLELCCIGSGDVDRRPLQMCQTS